MAEMRKRIINEKITETIQYKQEHSWTIKNYIFQWLDLVLVRNMAIEESLDQKMKPQYFRSMVVIA